MKSHAPAVSNSIRMDSAGCSPRSISSGEPTALPARPSIPHSPRERGRALRSVADFQTELFRVMAGFLPAVSQWELRRWLPEVIFRDARRCADLRIRARELGVGMGEKHLSLSTPGLDLIAQLCNAPDAADALSAVFKVIKPRLKAILGDYLRGDLCIFDAPSMPVVEATFEELDRQITWAESLIEPLELTSSGWINQIRQLIESLPGEFEENSRRSAPPVNVGRKIGNLPILRSVFPAGYPEGSQLAGKADAANYPDRALYHAHNFLWEIQATDSCASLLFEAPDMPWEFFFDVARHMWDESRHSKFGEMKLVDLGCDPKDLGLSNTAYVLRQTLHPLDRYVALTTQEADAFPGKHLGLQDAIANNDDLFARAWSYDIADETQHVRYGHKWIPILIRETQDPRTYDQIKQDAENWRREVLAPAFTPASAYFASKQG